MCIVCDATSLDHAIELLSIDIDDQGWTAVSTPPTDGRPRWVYTVGLEHAFDHPELLVVTCDITPAMALLHQVAFEIEDGESVFPGDVVVSATGDVEVVRASVAQHQHPLLPMREAYDASIRHAARPWPPLQLVAPGLTCGRHPLDTWRIDREGPLLAAPNRPNRAERRRQARHPRHR